MFPLLLLGLTSAPAVELPSEAHTALQVTAIAGAYAFSAAHTAIMLKHVGRGEPLKRGWVPGMILSAVSVAGLASGVATLGLGFTEEQDPALTYTLSAPAGLGLGFLQLGYAIDGGVRSKKQDWWMPKDAAWTSLAHGLFIGGAGSVLAIAPTNQESDLSKLLPIYSWSGFGLGLRAWAIASLAHGAKAPLEQKEARAARRVKRSLRRSQRLRRLEMIAANRSSPAQLP